jgi:hypothetical protein
MVLKNRKNPGAKIAGYFVRDFFRDLKLRRRLARPTSRQDPMRGVVLLGLDHAIARHWRTEA